MGAEGRAGGLAKRAGESETMAKQDVEKYVRDGRRDLFFQIFDIHRIPGDP